MSGRLNLAFPPFGARGGAFGYAAVAENLLRRLDALGYELALFGTPGSDDPVVARCVGAAQGFDPEAPALRLAPADDMASFPGRGLRCGFTLFETTRRTPAEKHHLGQLDLLIVASRWALEALLDDGFATGPPHRIAVVPLGVDPEVFCPGPPRFADAATTFLAVGKWEPRKGQDFLVEAFNRAFEPGDRVRLRLMCTNPFIGGKNRAWMEHCRSTRLGSMISFVGPLKTSAEVAGVMRAADCGVFPARAEGWNLPLLEMMACARTVIATDCSGHTAFADGSNCLLVEVDSQEEAEGFFGSWARLGNAQMEQLVEHMRSVHRLKQAGRLEPNTAGRATAERLSWENSARELARGIFREHTA